MLTVVIWEAFEASFKSLKFQRNALVVCVDKNYFLCLTTTTLQKVAWATFHDFMTRIARNEFHRYIIFDSFIFQRSIVFGYCFLHFNDITIPISFIIDTILLFAAYK